ncbi:MAG TPA: DNA-packaging protein [Terrisporobacter glycolicus]|uniref:head-tail connector protein n=1 Tax=Terrisporobacter TaxID=1505652 RepID=UPI000E91A753|nr:MULTISPECIES: head-tail connector protein [Terrisporobacter]HBI91198.1 DNA-packaging protein [Terrisporobacter hibernicus]
MLEKVKLALRISNNAFDSEINDLIESAYTDLGISGVKNIDKLDPLIKRAVIIYCKANFGMDNKDSEKYEKSYEMIKQHLALCGDYNE